MSTRSLIFNPNESVEFHKSNELQSISNQLVGHQGSYNIQYGTKTTTMSPVGLEGSYYVR